MDGFARRVIVWLWLAFVTCGLLSGSALATQTSGGNLITARIAPVRYVLINKSGQIIRIISNTPDDIAPNFYRQNFNYPVAANSNLVAQYDKIIPLCDARQRGVIYNRSNTPKINFYVSILFF